MSVEQTKSKITARIWQSIAQSGVSVSAIPQEQMTILVDAIVDGKRFRYSLHEEM